MIRTLPVPDILHLLTTCTTMPTPITVENRFMGDYKFLDYNIDGLITLKDKFPIKGCEYPPITYSFSGGFSYKGFDFNFMFQGNVGKYINYNQNFEVEFLKGNWSVHSSQLDYWRPDNQDANHPTLRYTSTTVIEYIGVGRWHLKDTLSGLLRTVSGEMQITCG